jgi:hypothetical protein
VPEGGEGERIRCGPLLCAALLVLPAVAGCCKALLQFPPSILDSSGDVVLPNEEGVQFHVTKGKVHFVGFPNEVSVFCAPDPAAKWEPVAGTLTCDGGSDGAWVAIVSRGKSSEDGWSSAFVCLGDCTDYGQSKYRHVHFVVLGE